MGYAPQHCFLSCSRLDSAWHGFLSSVLLFLFQSQRVKLIEHGIQNAFHQRQAGNRPPGRFPPRRRTALALSPPDTGSLRSGKGPGGGSRIKVYCSRTGGYRSLIVFLVSRRSIQLFFPGKAVRLYPFPRFPIIDNIPSRSFTSCPATVSAIAFSIAVCSFPAGIQKQLPFSRLLPYSLTAVGFHFLAREGGDNPARNMIRKVIIYPGSDQGIIGMVKDIEAHYAEYGGKQVIYLVFISGQ